MTTSTEQMRAWSGPAILSFGFRPFFLLAAVWATLSIALWILMLAGHLHMPSAFDAVSWHAHETLFGYLGAVVAGFLLTAVPNWTGRLPVVGWSLLALVVLWFLGRVAIALSGYLRPPVVAVVDLSCLVMLAVLILREIIAGKNWRNLIVLALLGLLIAGNALFHWEAARDGTAASSYGLRLGLATAIMMIAVIGGRIVPSFTRNWLVKRHAERLPATFGSWDRLALVTSLVALAFWLAAPDWPLSGVALLTAGLVQAVRLFRWQGGRTGTEPLVWILHVGYACVPIGMLAMGVAILSPATLAPAAAQHIWMAGAIGIMTLAVMTRATLGHTGRALTAGPGTIAIYGLVIASVLTRLTGDVLPQWGLWLYALAGLLWCAAFAGFAVLYGPMLLTRRHKASQP